MNTSFRRRERCFHRTVACKFLLGLLIVFACIVNEVSGKPDVRTKLLLQNIRTHLTRKAEEAIQQRECELGLVTGCKESPGKSDEDDNSSSSHSHGDDISPRSKVTAHHSKASTKVNLKDFVPKKLTTVSQRERKKHTKEEDKSKPMQFHQQHQQQKKTMTKIIKRVKDEKGEEEEEAEDKAHQKRSARQFVDKKEKFRKEESVLGDDPEGKKVEMKRGNTRAKTKPKEPEMDKNKKIPKLEPRVEPKDKRGKVKTKADQTSAAATAATATESDEMIFPSGAFFFSMDSNDVNNDLCKKHKNIYKKQLKKYKMWALMMFDASAKLPSGILQGNINQFGDFDECLSINAVFKKADPVGELSGIRGKYCLANVDVYTELANDSLHQALERIKSFSFVSSTISDPSHFVPRFSSINWGLCVPDACPAEDVEKLVRFQLGFINATTNLIVNVNVEESNCVVKDDLKFEFTRTMLAVLIFYSVVAAAAVFATYLDANARRGPTESEKIIQELQEASKDIDALEERPSSSTSVSHSKKDTLKRVLMAFSLKRNLVRLVEDDDDDTIGCINGIKAIFSIMLYLAHKTIPLGWTSFSNRIFLTKASNEAATVPLRTSIIYTDSFLLISGLLTAYNLSREITREGNIRWGKRILARYIRLTPALLSVLLFYAYVWEHLGSGPLWNTLVKQNSSLCRKYLWRNLLYIQNYFAFANMCAPQTHQLALDMQLSALAPFFVYLLHKYGKTGFGILQAVFLMSSIVRYTTTANNQLSIIVYHGIPVSQLYKTADKLYTQTLHRASPYLLGAIIGDCLQRFKGKIHVPKAFAGLCWILACFLGYYSLISPSNMAFRTYRYEATEASQYAALLPVSWSIALAWIIVACHLGFGGKLNEFLCNKGLLIFSRISYSFYLTQFLVFFYGVGVRRIPDLFTFTGSVNPTEFVVVCIISVIVTLLFDIPMTEIKKIILDRENTTKPEIEVEGQQIAEKNVNVEMDGSGDREAEITNEWEENFDEDLDGNEVDENSESNEVQCDDEDIEDKMDEENIAEDEDVMEEITDESRENDYGGDDDEDADAEETDEPEGEENIEFFPRRQNSDDQYDWIGRINE